MSIVSVLAFVLLAAYIIKVALFYRGAMKVARYATRSTTPTVSVIVAARNEESNIARCLESLSRLTYPKECREILVIDDQSTDGTVTIVEEFRSRIPGLRLLATTGVIPGLRGKANAVAQALAEATGEIILTTDADCAVPEGWIENTVRYYEDDVGCVCGFTLIRGEGLFAGTQCVDWAYLLTIAAAGVGWGVPLSAVGNNMSFRRAAYDEVGGYEAVGFSVTEDFALFKAIAEKTKWLLRYPADPGTLVWSEPCPTVRSLYHQKKRWGRGGVDIRFTGFAIMSVGFLMNLAILVLPFLGIPWWHWLIAFAGKSLADAAFLTLPLGRFGLMDRLRYFLPFQAYYLLYVTLLPFIVFLTGRVVWKGRKLA